jgi:ABC-type polar amino acid transport system ATPase subunit
MKFECRGRRDAFQLVTVTMPFARRVADRCAFMDRGEIVEIAAADTFFEAPRSPRLRAFLSQRLH